MRFVEYVRPYGFRKSGSIARPTNVELMARDLAASGCEFSIERLMDGTLSLECVRVKSEEVLAVEVCQNSLELASVVDVLVESAYKELVGTGKTQ